MKLKEFIQRLNQIMETEKDSDKIDVRMADNIPVVEPIFKDGTVFITDQK
jgi:hypothetical protein